jgi:hypothetical protein
VDPNLYTLTLTATEMKLVRLALANWDGWDNAQRTTVTSVDDEQDILYPLCGRIGEMLGLQRT